VCPSKHGRWAPLVAALTPLVVYLPLAVRRYGWSDDFSHLFWDGEVDRITSDARPLKALVFHLVFSPADDIDVLMPLRVIGIAGIAVLAWSLARWLRDWGLGPWAGAFLGASTALLPTFQIYGGWATAFAFPWVTVACSWALLTWTAAESKRAERARAFAVMAAGLSYYPPAAMFGWCLLAVRMVVTRTPLRRTCRQAISAGGLVLGSGAVAFAVARITIAGMGVDMADRVGLVSTPSEIVDKLIWFVTHPAVVAVRPFQISSPGGLEATLTALPVLLLIATGLWRTAPGRPVERAGWLGMIVVLVSTSFFVHLAVTDNQIEFRFMSGLTVAGWLLLVLAALTVAPRPPFRVASPRVLAPVCVVILVFLGAVAANNVNDLFVRPTRITERYVAAALEEFDADVHERIHVVNDRSWWPLKPDLGTFSTRTDLSHGWVEEPLIRLLLAERGFNADRPTISVSPEPEPGPTILVVDLRPLIGRL